MQMSASIDQLSVNHPVAGSSTARGANKNKDLAPNALSLFLFRVTPGSQADPLVDRFSQFNFVRREKFYGRFYIRNAH